jgi:hypothetical protein
MSYPVLQVPAGDVIPIMFTSYAGATGASVTLTGLAVTDIEIYKDGSVTQRASDAGYTLLDTDGIDFDGLTGVHGFSIDTGDNTDASFYTVGAWFTVVVSAVTIDSQTVNFIAAMFRLMPAESVAGKPKVDVDTFGGTAATTSGGRPEVNTTHAAGTAWGSGAITAASIAANAINAAKLDPDVTTELQSGLATAAALATVDSIVDDILLDTAEIGAAGAGLTNINLPNQTMDIVGNITGNLSGSVGSVTGAVGSVTGNVGGNVAGSVGSVTGAVGGNVTGSVGSLAAQAKADVNAEVLDVLNTDTFAEPGQEAPGATVSLVKKIGYLYKAWRNKTTQTATTYSLYADDTTTVDQKATVSDDATTYTRTEVATGP